MEYFEGEGRGCCCSVVRLRKNRRRSSPIPIPPPPSIPVRCLELAIVVAMPPSTPAGNGGGITKLLHDAILARPPPRPLEDGTTMEGTAGAHHCCFNDAYCRDPPPELQGDRSKSRGQVPNNSWPKSRQWSKVALTGFDRFGLGLTPQLRTSHRKSNVTGE
nr:hypothetical protein Iba_chr02cCG9150 [Ipomoea batatas]